MLGAALLTCAASASWGAETPHYAPTPSWVLPAPEISQGAPGSPLFALSDQQIRIADGAVSNYREVATRAVSADALAHMGTLTLNWQPFHGDLTVHHVLILRDGHAIDVLKNGQTFSVIRREQSLEKLEMNGVLTATLQVEGLRVGDILDVAYSVSVNDPTLKGDVQANALAMSEPFRIDVARVRILWPETTALHWKAYPEGLKAAESRNAGWRELSFALPAPKQPDLPVDAPKRFQPLPQIEVSSFADWNAVSAVFAPLYRPEGLIPPGSALAQEVAQIRHRDSDPKRRAAAALALVQDRVRYFAEGMSGGNYVPQAPVKTWSAGYGDCKAKTLLLLAMLHDLGVDAEPVLANLGQADRVSLRLPAPAAFNHILVHAKIGDEDLWLDGTNRGSRLEDLADPPPLRTVLPVRRAGAGLLELPLKAPTRATRTISVEIDDSAALGLAAPFAATVTVRGGAADALRVIHAQADADKLLALALTLLGGAVGPDATPVSQHFTFDDAEGAATISVTGIARPVWRRQDHAYRLRLGSAIPGLAPGIDRSRPAWKDIPVATGEPTSTLTTTRLRLPDEGRGVSLEGDADLRLDIEGEHYARKSSLAGGVLTIDEHNTNNGAELPAAALPSARAKLATARGRGLRLATQEAYPPVYLQAQAAFDHHKLDKLAALYTALIATKPQDAARYRNRAAFYASAYQRGLALADLDKALSLDGDGDTLMARGRLLETMGDPQRAAADYQAALALDPSSKPAITHLGLLKVDAGQAQSAVALVDERLATADDDKADWLLIKAQLLQRAKDAEGALTAVDKAIGLKATNAALLNERCWIKGTLAVHLDTALQDCTRAVELTEGRTDALDSRALVYVRLDRPTDALADLDAALDLNPLAASSLYLRAVVERRLGKSRAADDDAAKARFIAPLIDQEYRRWDIRT